MDQAAHNKIVSFIWGIADDVLRDVFVRGKYRDVVTGQLDVRQAAAQLPEEEPEAIEGPEIDDESEIDEEEAVA